MVKMLDTMSIEGNMHERMQVLHVACDDLLFMPTFRNVRQLLVEQRFLDTVIESLSLVYLSWRP